MIFLLVSFLLGGVIGALFGSVYVQRQMSGLRRDRAFLWARLRSLMELADAGLLHAESIDAVDALAETRELVREKRAVPVRRATMSDDDLSDENVPPLFPR